MKILGKEPAFYVGVAEAIIALLVTFNIPGLSGEQASLWVVLIVALGGALTAWTTRDTLVAALVAVAKAVLTLAVAYGLEFSQEQIGLVAALVTVIGGGYLRTQTGPVNTKVTHPTVGAAVPPAAG